MGDLIELLEKIFEGAIPRYLLWAMLVAFLLIALLRSIPFFRKEIVPIFYSAEKARRRNRRRQFAEHIGQELLRLNVMDREWDDERFTELEAEVEAEGRRRSRLLPFRVRRDLLRRESSLSRALQNSTERLIILEGAPGSGKSVALRHVALGMSRGASRSHDLKTVLPLYVNLKFLKRRREVGSEEAIDAELIAHFVLQSLNRANNRVIAGFLKDEFEAGLEEGTWFFLFDSFDEIPEILSSTDADTPVLAYADAIRGFLEGLNHCRGVIASREYRGPKYLSWPRFRIMPLTRNKQEELVRRADLSSEDKSIVLEGMKASSFRNDGFTENPMFLGLLCEYVRQAHVYPENDHSIFESFITNRLIRDEDRLQKRFDLSVSDLQRGAERIAFCLMADRQLGLSATREEIEASLLREGFSSASDVDRILDGLDYIKLGRIENTSVAYPQQIFNFAHRRLQEHLATELLLREPQRVLRLELLTNGIWRETAVVMLQTQSAGALASLLETAVDLTTQLMGELIPSEDESRNDLGDSLDNSTSLPQAFPWPVGLYHVLDLLHSGLVRRQELVPEALRIVYSVVVALVWDPKRWLLNDMQQALAIAGLLPQDTLSDVLAEALQHPSRRIRDIAYHQTSLLSNLQPVHISAIRRSLAAMANSGQLWRERKAITAFLLRLDQSQHLLDVVRFLSLAPYFGLVMGTILTWVFVSAVFVDTSPGFRFLLVLLFVIPLWGLNFEWRVPVRLLVPSILALLAASGVFLIRQYGFVGGSTFWALGFAVTIVPIFLAQRAVYRLAEHGEFVRPRRWPLALLIPPARFITGVLGFTIVILQIMMHGIGNLWRLLSSRRGRNRVLGSSLAWLPALLLAAAYVALVIYALNDLPRANGPTTLQALAMLVVSVPFYWFLVKEMVLPGIRATRRGFRNRKILRTISIRNTKLPATEFLQMLTVLSSTHVRVAYLSLIRERQLIQPFPNDLALLEKLMAQLQADLLKAEPVRANQSVSYETPAAPATFDQWYSGVLTWQAKSRETSRGSYGISFLGWEVLDELNALQVQVESLAEA